MLKPDAVFRSPFRRSAVFSLHHTRIFCRHWRGRTVGGNSIIYYSSIGIAQRGNDFAATAGGSADAHIHINIIPCRHDAIDVQRRYKANIIVYVNSLITAADWVGNSTGFAFLVGVHTLQITQLLENSWLGKQIAQLAGSERAAC